MPFKLVFQNMFETHCEMKEYLSQAWEILSYLFGAFTSVGSSVCSALEPQNSGPKDPWTFVCTNINLHHIFISL
jgi:hypothetical protein